MYREANLNPEGKIKLVTTSKGLIAKKALFKAVIDNYSHRDRGGRKGPHEPWTQRPEQPTNTSKMALVCH